MLILAAAASARADALLDRMKAHLASVKDYTCDVTLNASLPQIAVSNMRMTLYYKRPNRVHVEAKEGFALLPEEGLYFGDPVEQMLADYDLEPLGAAAWQGRTCAKYALRPKKGARPDAGSLRLYVDTRLALPVGFVGTGGKMGDVTTSFTFQSMQGKYWLPAKTTLALKGLPVSGRGRNEKPAARNGQAEVTFENYKINTGLPDSLFVRPPVEKPRTGRNR